MLVNQACAWDYFTVGCASVGAMNVVLLEERRGDNQAEVTTVAVLQHKKCGTQTGDGKQRAGVRRQGCRGCRRR